MAPTTRSQTCPVPTQSFVDLTTAEPETEPVSKPRARRRKSRKSLDAAEGDVDDVDTFVIDLSLPPAERYVALAEYYKSEIEGLPKLFTDLIHDFVHPRCPVQPLVALAKAFLRRLHRQEEMEEIRGIARVTGVDMYLLVAFNLMLDTLMGCSSGGIRVRDPDTPSASRMLHYRTLDWGMDPLREVVVQLHFVREPKGPIVARTLTYVGYTGVLTGVIPGLSMSLNFRAEHESDTYCKNLKYFKHCLMVLLGRRPSISTALRDCLFSEGEKDKPSLNSAVDQLRSVRTPAAFLILSDGEETVVIEKDLEQAVVYRSSDFIAATNNDAKHDPSEPFQLRDSEKDLLIDRKLRLRTAFEHLIAESVDRKQCMKDKWEAACKRYRRKHSQSREGETDLSEGDIIRWINEWPITNEATHFACIMDPTSGEIIWAKRRIENASAPAHMFEYYSQSHSPKHRSVSERMARHVLD